MKKKILISSVFLIAIDVISKLLIDYNFNLNETKPVILNFFSITKVYNAGASWGILNGARIALILVAIAVLVALIMYGRHFKENTRNTLAFGFLYAGIIGNLIDRTFYGYVIDFLDFQFGSYDFPVFNFADICITFGVLLLIIAIFKKEDSNDNCSR